MNHNSSVPLFLYLAYQSTHHPLPTPPRHYLVKLAVSNKSQKGNLFQAKYDNRSVYQDHLGRRNDDKRRAATITVRYHLSDCL